MVRYLQKNRNVTNGTKDTTRAIKKYMCECGSYIIVIGKLKHNQTEKHLISMDVELPEENIDGLLDIALNF